MSSWRSITLGQICIEAGGSIQTGPFGSQLHASDYVLDGIPTVMPQNIGSNVIIPDGIARVSQADVDRLSKYTLQLGDIVYSRRGDVERRALVRQENVGWLCGTGCLRVRLPANEYADATFVAYALGTAEIRSWIRRHAVGATMLNLNTSILSSVPLSVPDFGTQRAIAEVLGALDDKIAANSQLVVVADQLAGALLENEMDGTVEALANCATVTMGSSPPGTSYNEGGDGMPFFQGVRDFGVRFPTRRVWTTSPVRTAQPGDVLLSVRAPVGKTNMAREQLCIGRGLASIRSTAGTPFTMFHQIRAASAEWAPYESEGTIFGSINKVALGTIRIPSIRAQSRLQLESRLAALEGRIAAALTESDLLAKTRDEILPLLMSGKLRVKDAEKKVEAIA